VSPPSCATPISTVPPIRPVCGAIPTCWSRAAPAFPEDRRAVDAPPPPTGHRGVNQASVVQERNKRVCQPRSRVRRVLRPHVVLDCSAVGPMTTGVAFRRGGRVGPVEMFRPVVIRVSVVCRVLPPVLHLARIRSASMAFAASVVPTTRCVRIKSAIEAVNVPVVPRPDRPVGRVEIQRLGVPSVRWDLRVSSGFAFRRSRCRFRPVWTRPDTRVASMEPSVWVACASYLAAKAPPVDRGICFQPSVIPDWSATSAIRFAARACRLAWPAMCAIPMRPGALPGQVVFAPMMPTFAYRTVFAVADACRDRRVATRVWSVPAPVTVAAAAKPALHRTAPVP